MLPRPFRLAKNRDIRRVFRYGKKASSLSLGLKFCLNQLPLSRMTVIVSLKVDKRATKRNRLKRQIRAIFYSHLKEIKPGFDIVIMPQKTALEKKYQELEKELINLFKRMHLLKKT
jgi:ribonuclease P protein component